MTTENESNTPTEEAVENLDEAIQEEAAAVEEVTEEVVEEVAEEVADSAETAAEAAAEVAETIEEAVENATEGHADLTPESHGDEVYDRVLHRLREEGHISSPAIAEEVAGEAEHAAEIVEEAPAEVAAPSHDTIRPTSEHFWYRPRRIFGKSI
jgi:hypothetical protein